MNIIGKTEGGDFIVILTADEIETWRYNEESYTSGLNQPRIVEFKRSFIEALGHYDSKILNRAFSTLLFRTGFHFPKDDGSPMTFDEWAREVVGGRWTGADIYMFGEGQRKALREALTTYLKRND